ncbi:uncharacterized protein HMPREF1541_10031 [Cyphellophora europaea CBS 101466]|uniref:Uncharacterized protein n=1 Tax=Cyphellophora europaea (strain CBS 101466) TaxID=1220924 RepID=W2SB56_CYPE1|nr:uncharacterized protein HMPREF1541_10031 [Cyphellophora europaea CBS 101466]ETN45154.1 hypothetical protein HMPREF1541_10031 [Cyphellophora europaea CBS 101466]
MAEVISLLSSPPINPGKRSREKLPTRLPVADLFGSDDFDTTGDLDFHGEQPKKRRKPSPAPEAVIAARSGPQTLIAELDLSSEPDLPPSSAPADPGPSRPSFLDAFADDDEDDIEFSSSAPAISKNHRSKLDAVVHILSSDSITADDGARTRESAAPAAPAFSARVMEVLGAANISLRDDSGSKRIGKAANTSYKPTKPVRRSKNAIDDIIVSSPPSAASKKKSQASRADKEAQSTASKREREAAKEAEKQRKNDAKLEREKEKQKAKDMAEVNKSKANKKETSKEMILEMHGSLESTSIGDQVEEYMRQHEIQFSYTREEVSLSESAQHLDAGKTLRWKRKIEAAYDEDEGQWVPLDRSRIDLIDHVVILISGSEFASVALGSSDPDDLSESPSLEAMKRNLDRHMEHTRRQHKDRRLIYLIQGLHAWIKKNQNAKNREYTAAVRAQVAEETSNGPPASSQARKRKRAPASRHLAAVTADLAEDLQLYLQINHQPLVIHHTTSDAATASQILSFTQSLSARPYRLAELEHNLKSSSFYMGSGQFKTGDGVQETFCRMLEGQQRVTPSIAQSIAAEWPSPRELVAAFRTSDNLMLENVRKSTNKDGGYSDKRIGPVISKRMYKVFLGRIPEATDGMS